MWLSNTRQIKYSMRLCKILNFTRLLNYANLFFSYYLSRITGSSLHKGMPWALSVEPAGFCNLKCPECPVGADVLIRKGGYLSFDLFKKILTESQPAMGWLNLYFQGEPFLNSSLFDMINEAKNQNIFTVISTNGHFLDDENCQKLIKSGLSELIVSIDGIRDVSYSKYRKGGYLSKVQQGIKRLIEQRKFLRSVLPFVTIQFLIFKHNENEIDELKKWCKKTKVDRFIVKSAQINSFGDGSIEPPTLKKYSRYVKDENGRLIIKKKIKNRCFKQWSSAVFSWDGHLVPCCYDKNLEFSAGKITDNSLFQLWNSRKIKYIRKVIINDKKRLEMCNNCPEGRGGKLRIKN